MKSAFAAFFALVLFLSFSAPAGADFELVRKIPAPSMGCDSGYPLIKAMGSDYTYLVLVRGCYIDSLATVYRIDPDDGGIVNYDFWDYTIPECPGFTMPISMAYCPYDARYYVGTGCGAIVVPAEWLPASTPISSLRTMQIRTWSSLRLQAYSLMKLPWGASRIRLGWLHIMRICLCLMKTITS